MGKNQRSVVAIVTDFPKNSNWECVEMFKDVGDAWIDNYSEWSFAHLVKLHSADDEQQFLEVAKAKAKRILYGSLSLR